jgi:hypothetical protein
MVYAHNQSDKFVTYGLDRLQIPAQVTSPLHGSRFTPHVSRSVDLKLYGQYLQARRAALDHQPVLWIANYHRVIPLAAAESDGLAAGQLGYSVEEPYQVAVYLDLIRLGRSLRGSGDDVCMLGYVLGVRPPDQQGRDERSRGSNGRKPTQEQGPEGLRVEG